eukprot:s553_g9.t1
MQQQSIWFSSAACNNLLFPYLENSFLSSSLCAARLQHAMPFAMFQCAKSIVQSFTGIASEDFNDFVSQHLEDGSSSSTGSAVSFFEGSFVEALQAAADGEQCTEGRQLLLLWLHQKDDEDAQYLCRNLWADPSIAAELACRVLPWAGDVCRYEAGAVCRAVRAECPGLVLIKVCQEGAPGAIEWPRGSFFQVLYSWPARVSPRELLRVLKSVADQQDLQQQLQRQWQEQLLHLEQFGQNVAKAFEEAQATSQRLEELRKCEEEERPCWGALFESRYEVALQRFHPGGFAEAHHAAMDAKKLLLLWSLGAAGWRNVYPLKVAYCIPILLSAKAHDLCKEPPEPKARKAPQRS